MRKREDDHEIERGDEQRQNWEASAARHANCRRQPDNGGYCETADIVSANKDKAAADEPDACDDSRRDTGGIEDIVLAQNISESILRDDHDRRRWEPNQRMAAKASTLLTDLALKANEGRQHEGQREFADLINKMHHPGTGTDAGAFSQIRSLAIGLTP